MAFRKVITWPSPALKQASNPVEDFGEELHTLIGDMVDTLRVRQGAGLAAPQIGRLQRVVILRCSCFGYKNDDPSPTDDDLLVLVNPELKLGHDVATWYESCLSVPYYGDNVRRNTTAQVLYQDVHGVSKSLDAPWPFAGALQHEIDHLDGILFLDRLEKKDAANLKRRIHRRLKVESKMHTPLKRRPRVHDSRTSHGPGKRKKRKK